MNTRILLALAVAAVIGLIGCSSGDNKSGDKAKEGDYAAEPGQSKAGQ
jgi:outer membrane lipoprotein SlyB